MTGIERLVLLTAVLFAPTGAYSWEDDELEACLDARSDARSVAAELESAAESLASCASYMDLDDDCSSEGWDVESAASDYEDAVSRVQYECP